MQCRAEFRSTACAKDSFLHRVGTPFTSKSNKTENFAGGFVDKQANTNENNRSEDHSLKRRGELLC